MGLAVGANLTEHIVRRYLDSACKKQSGFYSILQVPTVPDCYNVKGETEGKSFKLECSSANGQVVKHVYNQADCGGKKQYKRSMRWGFFKGHCSHYQNMHPALSKD